MIDYLQHYEQIHHVTLPVRYELCVCATKGRAGLEPTDPKDWAWYMPGHDSEKDPAQIAHPVTAMSDDGSAVPEPVLQPRCSTTSRAQAYTSSSTANTMTWAP